MVDLELHMKDDVMSHINLDDFFSDLLETGDFIGAYSLTIASSLSPDSGLSWFDEIENILMKDDDVHVLAEPGAERVKAYKPKSKTNAGDQELSLNGNKEDEVKKFKLKSKIDTDVRELSSGANRGSKTRQTAGLGSAVTNAGANDSIKDGNDKLNSTCEDKEKKNKESMSYINNTCSLNNRYSVLSQN